MKKKRVILTIIIIFSLITLSIIGYISYQRYRIANATIKVKLKKDLNIEVYSKVKLKDLIESINGKIAKNFSIDTTKLGSQDISFTYINDENIKLSYKFKIKIVDTTPPVISMYNNYSRPVNYEGNIAEELFCGDNYDDNPKCEIVGEYNLNEPGTYPVTFTATDSSGNTKSYNFNLNIYQKSSSSSSDDSNDSSSEIETTSFSDIVTKFKSKKTKIGIDVSHWQGDIDFKKVKSSGVEFAFIRVGSQKGINGKYYLDNKFKQNIKGFTKQKIPVGIYFYSYANSKKAAIKEAKWIIKQIKKYKIDLPIVFDWENWSFYQEFNLSFYHLTEMANAFISTVEKAGYQGMLYSSKNYLENIWFPSKKKVWLAHYTDQTNYEGPYKFWQLCSNGKVDGIADNTVDINIMY